MEKITLRVFLTCMVLCASGFILGIWFEEHLPQTIFKVNFTFFVVGFGSFILWATRMTYRFLERQ